MISDIANNINLIISAPNHLWLRWLFIFTGLGLISWGAYRSGLSDQMRDDAVNEAVEKQKSLISTDIIHKIDKGSLFPALCSVNPALHLRPKAFNGVRGRALKPDIFMRGMVDRHVAMAACVQPPCKSAVRRYGQRRPE